MPTLHLIGVPHTVPNEDFALCAYTNKVRLFPAFLQPCGWRVVEYANEGSDSEASEHVTILSAEQFVALSKRKSRDEPHDADVSNKALHDAFQRVLLRELRARARPGDLVGHIFGPNIAVHDALRDCHHVELCVGYSATPGLPFRIFETSAWLHWHLGKNGTDNGSNYHFVVPSPIDVDKWQFCSEPDDYALFFGRLVVRKGMEVLLEIAWRMPELPILAVGPGDASEWAKRAPPNLTFRGPMFGAERVEIVQRARCQLAPTIYIEPFGNSGPEGMLCGVPLIGSSFGAFQETIVEGVNGYRCHTLADWCRAVELSFVLDRRQIADWAHARYCPSAIGGQYDAALRQIADLSGRGWYSARSRKFAMLGPKRRIYLYIPYFGALPTYFQLYLDSLGRNTDCLSVIFLTDADLSGYRLPTNLIPFAMTLDRLRVRIAKFLAGFGAEVEPEALLKQPHKLTDFKILYPILFGGLGDACGVTEDDFVGWGDVDLVYGQLADFLDLEDYHVIGGLFGHFTALRNTAELKTLYQQMPDLLPMLIDESNRVIDEIPFRKPLLDLLQRNQWQRCPVERYFCDIIPECFFDMFPNHARSNFFDSTHPQKGLRYVHVARDGRLTVSYEDGSSRPAAYVHLQKRTMAINFQQAPR